MVKDRIFTTYQMKRIIFKLLFLVCASFVCGQTLHFTNGDRISGVASGIDDSGRLIWQPKEFSETLALNLEGVKTISLYDEAYNVPRINVGVEVKMNRGDVYYGEISQLDEKSLTLNTVWGGEMQLKMDMVSTIYSLKGERYFLDEVGSVSDWNEVKSRKKWVNSASGIKARARGALCREVGVDHLFHASFNVEMSGAPRLRILFLATEGGVYEPESYIEFVVQRNTISGRARLAEEIESLGQVASLEKLDQSQRCQFDLYFDLKENILAINLDGILVAKWNLPSGLDQGSWLYIFSDYEGEISIDDFFVKSWNGAFPLSEEKKEEFLPNVESPFLILNNGDLIEGELLGMEQGKLEIKTSMGELEVPMTKLNLIDLFRTPYSEAKRQIGDIFLQLKDGSKVTLQLAQWKESFIRGYSQNFGEVSINVEDIVTADFNIYKE